LLILSIGCDKNYFFPLTIATYCRVHLRKSNTEPIIRCIVEAKTKEEAESLAEKYVGEIAKLN